MASIFRSRKAMRKLVREFHDRGTKWLMESPQNVRDLMALTAPELYDQLDFDRLEKLPSSMIPASLRKQEADLVFRLPYRVKGQERELLIFLLLEHQSGPDPIMAFRLLFYMVMIWDSQRQRWDRENTPAAERLFWPIIPVVFYTGSDKWDAPLTLADSMDLPDEMAGFVPRFDSLFLKLHDKTREELLADQRPFGWLMHVIQKEDSTRAEFEQALMEAVDRLSGLEDRAEWERAVTYLFLLLKHRRGAKEAEDLSQKIEERIAPLGTRREILKMEQTLAQLQFEQGVEQGLKQGVQQGLKQGVEQGLKQGVEQGVKRGVEQGEIRAKQDALLRLMALKFGVVPTGVVSKVKNLREKSGPDACMDKTFRATHLADVGLGAD